MYKAKKRDIDFLLNCSDSAEVKELFKDTQPNGYEVAYFAPSGANWCYRVLITKHSNGNIYEVVTQFGIVKGGRQLYV